jgi:uncharacterized protein YneR
MRPVVPRKTTTKAELVFAESENVSVYACSGGCLHLQLGRVSLAVTHDEFIEIATVLRAAKEHMQLHDARIEGKAH